MTAFTGASAINSRCRAALAKFGLESLDVCKLNELIASEDKNLAGVGGSGTGCCSEPLGSGHALG